MDRPGTGAAFAADSLRNQELARVISASFTTQSEPSMLIGVPGSLSTPHSANRGRSHTASSPSTPNQRSRKRHSGSGFKVLETIEGSPSDKTDANTSLGSRLSRSVSRQNRGAVMQSGNFNRAAGTPNSMSNFKFTDRASRTDPGKTVGAHRAEMDATQGYSPHSNNMSKVNLGEDAFTANADLAQSYSSSNYNMTSMEDSTTSKIKIDPIRGPPPPFYPPNSFAGLIPSSISSASGSGGETFSSVHSGGDPFYSPPVVGTPAPTSVMHDQPSQDQPRLMGNHEQLSEVQPGPMMLEHYPQVQPRPMANYNPFGPIARPIGNFAPYVIPQLPVRIPSRHLAQIAPNAIKPSVEVAFAPQNMPFCEIARQCGPVNYGVVRIINVRTSLPRLSERLLIAGIDRMEPHSCRAHRLLRPQLSHRQ
jgi:hypothetical protein